MRITRPAALLFALIAAAHGAERDPWQWPFASTSIWNMPIGSEAAYAPAGLAPAKNVGIDEELLFRASADAPKRPLFAPKSWENRAGGTQQVGEVRIDDAVTVPDARKWHTPNACAALLLPDGRTVRHVGVLCRPEPGGPVYGYPFNPDSDLHGDGIHGSHGGSGLSALGGSIRLGELTGEAPIRHALKVDLDCHRYAYFAEERPGFRWPATRADSYAASRYGGKNRSLAMGSLLAIPPSVTEASLGLHTEAGRKLFHALQDYGAYVVDDAAWDCHYLCAEKGVVEEVEKAAGAKLGGSSGPLFEDVNALFTQLQVVENNAPDRIGGGGTPRQPLAPALAAAPSAPPKSEIAPAPATTPFQFVIKNGGMTQGNDVPDDWRGKFGDITAARDTTVFREAPASLRVDGHGAGKNGQAFQEIKGGAGAKIRVAGWIKTKGNVKAQAVVQAFAEGYKNNQFIQLKFVQGESDWAQFEKEVELLSWTAFFHVGLMVEGEGSAWLDEVRAGSGPVDAGKPMTEEERMTTGAPAPGKPWEPAWGFYPQFPKAWQSTFKGELEQTKKGGGTVVFLGDSITQGWGDSGKIEWQKHFAPLGAVNYGIGGDSTRQVLWRIEHGVLDGLQTKLVVLKIGTNNLYGDFNAGSDEEIVRGVETIIQKVRAKQPSARVLLLGILPRQNEFFSSRIKHINTLLAKLDDGGKSIRFLEIGDRFASTPGKGDVHEELYIGDKLHLTPQGYHVFAEAIAPAVAELLR